MLTSTISLNSHLNWPHVGQVCQVKRERLEKGKLSNETSYYVTSLSREQADADRLLKLTRAHWGSIENGLHYVRDTTMDEDRCTIFAGHAAQNLAAFRNTALNWLRRRTTGSLAATIRSFTRKSQRLLTRLGLLK